MQNTKHANVGEGESLWFICCLFAQNIQWGASNDGIPCASRSKTKLAPEVKITWSANHINLKKLNTTKCAMFLGVEFVRGPPADEVEGFGALVGAAAGAEAEFEGEPPAGDLPDPRHEGIAGAEALAPGTPSTHHPCIRHPYLKYPTDRHSSHWHDGGATTSACPHHPPTTQGYLASRHHFRRQFRRYKPFTARGGGRLELEKKKSQY